MDSNGILFRNTKYYGGIMSSAKLVRVLLRLLKHFSTKEATGDSKLRSYLTYRKGVVKAVNPDRLYKSLVNWTMIQNKIKTKGWPKDWLDLTPKKLAIVLLGEVVEVVKPSVKTKVIVTTKESKSEKDTKVSDSAIKRWWKNLFSIVIILSLTSTALPAKDLFSTAIGLVRTHSDQIAARALFNLSQNHMKPLESFGAGETSGRLFSFQPEVKLEMGSTISVFNGVMLKLTGTALFFSTEEFEGLKLPDLNKVMHALPVSLAVETDGKFRDVGTLIEVGYVPIHLKQGRKFRLGDNFQWGIFVQAGYKFQTSKSNSLSVINDRQTALGRIKTIIKFEQTLFDKAAVVLDSEGWFDLINSRWYYKAAGSIRITILPGKNLEFKYQRGSGAPNFIDGNQFGANLVLDF